MQDDGCSEVVHKMINQNLCILRLTGLVFRSTPHPFLGLVRVLHLPIWEKYVRKTAIVDDYHAYNSGT